MFNSKKNYNRWYIGSAIFAGVLLLPWWVSFCIGLIACWRYAYYEFIIVGFLLDLLYGSPVIWKDSALHPPLFFTWLCVGIVIAFQLLKKKVRLQ